MQRARTVVSWNDTLQEKLDLIRAVDRNCACLYGLMGVRLASCPTHLMLAEDQRALDGLLFGRRIAAQLRNEEWLVRAPTADALRGS
jgi:hypothetical protein